MKALLLPGSRRENSLNRRLLDAIAAQLEIEGVEVDRVVPGDLVAPLYDGDLEASDGVPDSIKALNKRMDSADALVVVTPEYNGFFPALLKNTLDWMSRKTDGEAGSAVLADKPALILAASPGGRGGLRALPHLRLQLANLGLNVYRQQLGVGNAGKVLGDGGEVLDEALSGQLADLARNFAGFAKKLAG